MEVALILSLLITPCALVILSIKLCCCCWSYPCYPRILGDWFQCNQRANASPNHHATLCGLGGYQHNLSTTLTASQDTLLINLDEATLLAVETISIMISVTRGGVRSPNLVVLNKSCCAKILPEEYIQIFQFWLEYWLDPVLDTNEQNH